MRQLLITLFILACKYNAQGQVLKFTSTEQIIVDFEKKNKVSTTKDSITINVINPYIYIVNRLDTMILNINLIKLQENYIGAKTDFNIVLTNSQLDILTETRKWQLKIKPIL